MPVTLNNDVRMPIFGLGTYRLGWENDQIDSGRVRWLICSALDSGYRMFDTSPVYGTEKILGEILTDELFGEPEDQAQKRPFLITKISNTQQKGRISEAIESSLQSLRVPVIDLLLVHWPVPDRFLRTWSELEKAYEAGLCRAIGVSNFHVHHLEALLEVAKIVPAVNQVEMHPLLAQSRLRDFCERQNIHVQAYSPFGRGSQKLLKHPVVRQIASDLRRTPAQVLLRWVLDQGCSVVLRTSQESHMRSNRALHFSLSESHHARLRKLDAGYRFGYDPDNCDFNQL